MRSLQKPLYLLLVWLPLCASCISELDELRQQLAEQTRKLEQWQDYSRLGWSQSLCSRDARLLMAAVQRECENGTCDLENPPPDVITAQVCSLDPKRRERFLEILAEQQREIFYLYSNTKSLSDESRKRLHALVMGVRPLPTTRFLIVTRPWDREADKRGHAERRGRVVQNAILEILLQYQKAEVSQSEGRIREVSISELRKQRTLLWTYAFPLRPGMKTRPSGPNTLPAPGKPFDAWSAATNTDAPPDDERSIWVFRLDC